MKIIVADDEQDICELIRFVCEAHLPCTVYEALSGNQAIELLREHDDCDLIFCDYNMPDGNGADVFRFIRENMQQCAYVMVSSDSPEDHPEIAGKELLMALRKPDIADGLESAIDTIVSRKNIPRLDSEMVPVRIHCFEHVNPLPCDIYIRLSDTKTVKIFSTHDIVSGQDRDKYEARSVDNLYIKRDDLTQFARHYENNVQVILANKEYGDSEKFEASYASMQSMIQSMGFNDQVIASAKRSIQHTLKMIDRNPTLAGLLQNLNTHPNNYTAYHSLMVAHIACTLADKLSWGSDQIKLKLSAAAFLHDISLPSPELARLQTLTELKSAKSKFSEKECDEFKHHPELMAKLVREAGDLPPDLDTILLEHHELPDGSGFPKGLSATQIRPLAAVFIVAHKTANCVGTEISEFSTDDIVGFGKGFNDEPFKEMIAAVRQINFC